MIIELLAEMEDALRARRPGLFQDLIRNGVFTSKVLFHREVFLYLDKEKRLGNGTSVSVKKTADKFNVIDSTVYKIMKSMKE